MLASVTMCNDDIRNYNSKISDLGYLTIVITFLNSAVVIQPKNLFDIVLC